MPKSEKLFAYGTLRRGFPLHAHIGKLSLKYLGRGTIKGHLYNLGNFPGAVPSSQHNIIGELYEIPGGEHQLGDLDKLEEFFPDRSRRSLFIREKTGVRLRNGKRVSAWVYFLPRRPRRARLIESGDYAAAVRKPLNARR